MLHRHRLLNSENHTGENIGEANPIVRADFEDALVEALEDTIRDGRLDAFRSLLKKKWGAEFPRWLVNQCLTQDSWGWYTVYYFTCTLRRMQPRWEHAANKLMQQYGMDPQQIPQGHDWLNI